MRSVREFLQTCCPPPPPTSKPLLEKALIADKPTKNLLLTEFEGVLYVTVLVFLARIDGPSVKRGP